MKARSAFCNVVERHRIDIAAFFYSSNGFIKKNRFFRCAGHTFNDEFRNNSHPAECIACVIVCYSDLQALCIDDFNSRDFQAFSGCERTLTSIPTDNRIVLSIFLTRFVTVTDICIIFK